MIYFITDCRPGEPDILTPLRHQPLRITTLDGTHITTLQAPAAGWTHKLLEHHARRLTHDTRDGADAWLASRWIGSTEV